MKIIRHKQEPVFSVLEEMDLDNSIREKEKDSAPPEEIPVVTQPEAKPEPQQEIKQVPAVDSPSAVIVAEPIFDLPLAPEICSVSIENEKVSFSLPPSEDIQEETKPEPQPEAKLEPKPELEPKIKAEPKPESVAARQTPVIQTRQLPDPSRATGVRLSDVPFVYIAPGSFLMGSPENEPGRGGDEMQHEVTLTRGYSIQVTPVTQGQWKAVMGSNPSNFAQGGQDCPVEGVNWNDCQEFITRVNKMGEHVYRLPTEAEWEYACRAGASTAFFNGEITDKLFSRLDPCLDAIGWYSGNSGKKTHPVAEKKPNAWGLFDMHGNVSEWCQDWYGEYAALPKTDPRGATFGPGCVVRGGSWSSKPQGCRSAIRSYRSPSSRSNFVGFRLVRKA